MPKHFLRHALCALLVVCPCWAGPYTLSLLPDAALQGNPGDVLGWGYSITNNSTDFLLPLNLDAGLFPGGFTPLNIFDFPVVAPGTTVTLDFSQVLTGTCASPPCGIYQVTLDPSLAPGATVTGFFDVFVELYSGDPFNGGTDLQEGADLIAAYSAGAATPVSGVPEPATLATSVIALTVLMLLSRRANPLKPISEVPLFGGLDTLSRRSPPMLQELRRNDPSDLNSR